MPPGGAISTLPDLAEPPKSAAADSLGEVIDAFQDLRGCIADLLIEVRADPNKTRESARVLGLNRGLVWRLTRVVRAPDMAGAVSNVPARASLNRFIDACAERGAPQVRIEAIRTAIERFESSVGRCSGDRKTLSMLMANTTGQADSVEGERARRKAFEGQCAVWGVQAHVRFVSVFLFPATDDPGFFDVAHVTGYVGFRRLRATPWPLSYEAVQSRAGQAVRFRKEPLDAQGHGGAQLLSRFCDPPNPNIEVVTLGSMKRFELTAGPVGNEGVSTCVFGTYLQHLYPRVESEEHAYASFAVLLETPVERVLFDMFVHRDIGLAEMPTAHLCDRLTHPAPPADDDVAKLALPVSDRPTPLGRGASSTLSPHIPWYPRLVHYVTERTGHAPEEFSGSRFEMAYPPIPTALVRRFPLAKASSGS